MSKVTGVPIFSLKSQQSESRTPTILRNVCLSRGTIVGGCTYTLRKFAAGISVCGYYMPDA